MIDPDRISLLNRKPVKNHEYVLYWMQQAQRSVYNHALEYAIMHANEMKKPLVVYFGITDTFPEANIRHYAFMLQGLQDVDLSLKKRGIRFVLRIESPLQGVIRLAHRACMVVTDRGYLRIQRKWRSRAARSIDCAMHEIESDVIVPIARASTKEEYSAATIRPKIHAHLKKFLKPLKAVMIRKDSLDLRLQGMSLYTIEPILEQLAIDRSVPRIKRIHGGTRHAHRALRDFITRKLASYEELRNDPNTNVLSGMSPYLHFGQISPLDIALRVNSSSAKAKNAFLEQLIIRRDLSMNFVWYNQHYDTLKSLPAWAHNTLAHHAHDTRAFVYTRNVLEQAATHDPYWNAAQRQMMITGNMHGYMRMYWGKKILEWIKNPGYAYATALYLNNKYELDGRDPNGFAGIAWCFGKHDRPWAERPVFGTVRYMNDRGLKRKFNVDAYVAAVNALGPLQ